MNKYILYLRLQLKSALQLIPKLLAGTLLFAFLAFIISYVGAKSLYNSNRLFYFKVAAVLPEDDAMVEMGYNMLMEMGNLEEYCEIVNTDEATAMKLLRSGEVYCVVYIPEGFVEDVLNGTNTPAKLVLPDNLGLETIIFKSVLNAGASSLAYAQAGIYALSDVYYLYDLRAEVDEAIEDLNMDYIKFVFNRGNFNDIVTLESTDVLSLTQFYLCCGLTMLMLFLGLILGGYVKLESKTTTIMLKREGLSPFYTVICKTLVITLIQGALLGLLILLARIGVHAFASLSVEKVFNTILYSCSFANVLKLFLCELLATSYIVFIYEVAGTGLYGMLALFTLNCGMMFASGLIIPSVYLPAFVRTLGAYLPAAGIKSVLTSMFTNNLASGSMILVIAYIVGLSLISGLIKNLYQEQEF